jgi:hypothetical protein
VEKFSTATEFRVANINRRTPADPTTHATGDCALAAPDVRHGYTLAAITTAPSTQADSPSLDQTANVTLVVLVAIALLVIFVPRVRGGSSKHRADGGTRHHDDTDSHYGTDDGHH